MLHAEVLSLFSGNFCTGKCLLRHRSMVAASVCGSQNQSNVLAMPKCKYTSGFKVNTLARGSITLHAASNVGRIFFCRNGGRGGGELEF